MCGRFINLNKIERLSKIFDVEYSNNYKNNISYNIAPKQSSLIIINNKSYYFEEAIWGFQFFDKKNNIQKNVINSRLETIKDKLLFKDSFEKRKCIIPASGYYEWSIQNDRKIPYIINIPIFETIYFAGIWKYLDFNNSKLKIFSIITKKSNILLNKIHNRMPLILSYEEATTYLDSNNLNYFNTNFQSSIEDDLVFFEVSKFVNNPINNSKECVKPVN